MSPLQQLIKIIQWEKRRLQIERAHVNRELKKFMVVLAILLPLMFVFGSDAFFHWALTQRWYVILGINVFTISLCYTLMRLGAPKL